MEVPSHHYPDGAVEPGDGCLSLQKKAQIADLRLLFTQYLPCQNSTTDNVISPSGKYQPLGPGLPGVDKII